MYAFVSLALALACSSYFVNANIVNQCRGRGVYAMTWDDGPAQYTNQLLDILASKNVKATFHITTKYLTDPNIQSMVQKISSAGHLIGLRTESDWNLFQMSDDQIRAGVARQATVLSSFIGYTPKFIRLPYNGYDDRVLRAIESTGLIATIHNLETYDYNNNGPKILNAVKLSLSLLGKGQGSFISIQHDGVQQSVGIAGQVIDTIKSFGYRFVKLDECLGLGDMTKNKEPLKGADDSVDLGPMDSPQGSNGMASDPSGGMPGVDGNLNGQNANMKNSAPIAVAAAPAILATMIAILLSLLIQF